MPARRIKERKKVLPDGIHFLRGRHWPSMQRIMERQGEGLKKFNKVRKVIQVFEKRKLEGKAGQAQKAAAARAIEWLVSELTDEVIKRSQEQGLQHGTWNQEYVNCLLHFWRNIPDELRHEIVHQSKNQ